MTFKMFQKSKLKEIKIPENYFEKARNPMTKEKSNQANLIIYFLLSFVGAIILIYIFSKLFSIGASSDIAAAATSSVYSTTLMLIALYYEMIAEDQL